MPGAKSLLGKMEGDLYNSSGAARHPLSTFGWFWRWFDGRDVKVFIHKAHESIECTLVGLGVKALSIGVHELRFMSGVG